MRHEILKLLKSQSRFTNRPDFVTGQAVLTTVIFLLFASVALLLSFSSIALKETSAVRADVRAKQSFFLAEAGLEDMVWRVGHGRQYLPSQTMTLDGSSAVVTVSTVGSNRAIQSSGTVLNSVRRARTILSTGSGISFVYGVQVGDLGITMGNNTSIIGNIYSDGDITGGGVGNSTVTGTAIAAGAHTISDISVNLDAFADRFEDCRVDGVTHYVTSYSNCTLSTVVHDASTQPTGTFPITQDQIDGWKDDAANGGVSGSITLGNNSSTTLGPQKINGNITFGNGATLTITGTIWVTGTLVMGNNVTIKLDPGTYGTASGLLILDGSVDLGNSASFQGTGQTGSYLMILTTVAAPGGVTLGNSASGAIFYAPEGVITVGNNLGIHEVTARGLVVGNNTSITYDSGLANVNFSSGPTGGWSVQSWNEVK